VQLCLREDPDTINRTHFVVITLLLN